MGRFRLLPSVEQAAVFVEHCRHARFVWNLAVEQQRHWQPGRKAPGYNEQCAGARAEYGWLAAGQRVARLTHKARGRLQVVPAAYTSQRCSHCGHVALENRKSPRNIAAGRVVTAR
jgi:hypothetical protein